MTHATLTAIRTLMTDPTHWTKGEYHNDHNNPTCFCLTGAVAHVEDFMPIYEALDIHPVVIAFANLITDDPEEIHAVGASEIVANWNDQPHRTHEQVLKLIDRALETAS